MALNLSGVFLSIERKSGVFNNAPYDFSQAHILDGDSVRKVRLPKGAHVLPYSKFDEVSVPLTLSDDGTKMFIAQDDYAALLKGEVRAA